MKFHNGSSFGNEPLNDEKFFFDVSKWPVVTKVEIHEILLADGNVVVYFYLNRHLPKFVNT